MPAVAVIGLVFSVGLNVAHLMKQGGLSYILFFVLEDIQSDDKTAIGLSLGLTVPFGETSPDDDGLREFAVPVLTIVGVKNVLHLASGVWQGGRGAGRGGLFNLLRLRGHPQGQQQQNAQQALHRASFYFSKYFALISVKCCHFSGRSSTGKIAVTGQTGTQAPQSMHSVG